MKNAIISNPQIKTAKDDKQLYNAIISAGCKIEYVLPHGYLISGGDDQINTIEIKGYRVYLLPDKNILVIGKYRIDIEKGPAELPLELQVSKKMENNWTHFIVQLIAPPNPEWIEAIEKTGAKVIESISRYGLFIEANNSIMEVLSHLTFIAWHGYFQPAYRIHQNIDDKKGMIEFVRIIVHTKAEAENVRDELKKINAYIHTDGISETNDHYYHFVVKIDKKQINKIANLRGVRWIEYASPEPGLLGEKQDQILAHNLNDLGTQAIPGYVDFLTNDALVKGNNTIVSICDTGVDVNAKNNDPVVNYVPRPALQGRQVAFVEYAIPAPDGDTNGHGSHVAGIAAGNAADGLKDADNFLYGLGLAPNTRYVTQNALMGPWPPTTGWGTLSFDAKGQGADIMNNSWHDLSGVGSGYTANASTWDKLVRDPANLPALKNLIVVFAAGNSGPNLSTMLSPQEAKNPITVGNTQKDSNIDSLRASSSRGPAADGRYLPNVVAPGTNISSVLSSKSGGVPIPGTHSMYTYMSGTSMAAPAVSGISALLSEWWKNRKGGEQPSPAMIKAILINGADDIEGGTTGRTDASGNPVLIGHIPNNDQGWGRVNIKNMLVQHPLTKRSTSLYYDQTNPFTANGQEFSVDASSILPTQAMRITLVWTDKFGSAGANPALVNNLNLEVTSKLTGNIYKGNVFDVGTGFSKTGGNFDTINNVECIYIEKPDGVFTVKVIAADLKGNAQPPFDNTPWQDFALVIENAEVGTPNPISIALLVDRSPSMSSYGYVGTTKTAAENSVNLTYIEDQFAVVSYSTNQTVEFPLTKITATAVRDNARAKISNINFNIGQMTAIGDAMNVGAAQLNGAVNTKGMLLLTDGINNRGANPITVANSMKSQNIRVFTLPMGPASDQNLLQQIANITGGVMKYMPNVDDLFEVFNYLRSDYAAIPLAYNGQANILSQGITVRISAQEDQETSFTIQWKDTTVKYVPRPPVNKNEITLEVINPSGAVLTPEEIFIHSVTGSGFVMFRLQRGAIPGPWTIKVKSYNNQPFPYTLAAFEANNNITKEILTDVSKSVKAGKPIQLDWHTLDYGEPVKEVVSEIEVIAPKTSIENLQKKHAEKLATIKPDKALIEAGMPEHVIKLNALHKELLPNENIFETVKTTTTVKDGNKSGKLSYTYPNTKEKGVYNIKITTKGYGHKSEKDFQRVQMISILVK